MDLAWPAEADWGSEALQRHRRAILCAFVSDALRQGTIDDKLLCVWQARDRAQKSQTDQEASMAVLQRTHTQETVEGQIFPFATNLSTLQNFGSDPSSLASYIIPGEGVQTTQRNGRKCVRPRNLSDPLSHCYLTDGVFHLWNKEFLRGPTMSLVSVPCSLALTRHSGGA